MAGSSSGSSQSQSSSYTFLSPEKKAAFANLNTFLADPLAGVGSVLRPIMDALVPAEDMARRNLSDEFRKAGALNSGAFATSARQLEGDLFRNRNEQAYKAGLAFLQPLIAGRVGALQGIPALSQSNSSSSSQQQAQSSDPHQFIGFNTPSGLDRSSSDFGFSGHLQSPHGSPVAQIDPFRSYVEQTGFTGAYQPPQQAFDWNAYEKSFQTGTTPSTPFRSNVADGPLPEDYNLSLYNALNDPGILQFDRLPAYHSYYED